MTTNKDAAIVNLINVTHDALELLILTKSGRLNTGTTLEDIMGWTMGKKLEHLGYMMDTIKTSFEFVDYVFEIKNVSRAFTHQLVRTRTASFQQQSQRTVDASEFGYHTPTESVYYTMACDDSLEKYSRMLDAGVPIQDARGVLPTAIHTSIFVKANLRTLSGMAELRLCKRTQGEYQDVFKKMVAAVLHTHPWATPLLEVHCVRYGICAFPRYKKCPIQHLCYDPSKIRDKVREAWKKSDHTAIPVVNKSGMTM